MIKYSKYKSSNIEWLRDIPEHWKVSRLKNITAKSIGGVWGEEPNEDGKDTIVVRVADFDRDKASISDSDEFTYRAISQNHLLDRKLNINDILLEKSGGGEKQLVGKAVIFDKDFDAVCANFIQKVEILDCFNKRFILHVLTSIYDGKINFPYVNQTTGIQNLDITAFFNHKIAFPKSKEEQRAIANYLDIKTSKLDQLISNKKAQIKKLKEIRQIEINTAVTKGLNPNVKLKDSGVEWIGDIPVQWSIKRLKQNTYLKGRIGWQNLRADEFVDEGPYCITGTDFKDGVINWKTSYRVTEKRYEIDHNIHLEEGDLIITKDGTIGKVARVTDMPYKATLNSGIMLIRPTTAAFHTHFLYWTLNSEVFYQFNEYTKSGSTILHLYQNVFERMPFPIPTINEQTAIANYLDEKTSKIDQLVSNLENQINQLQEIRKIEIYNAVTGKIKVA